MQNFLPLLATLATATAAFAQGQINFNNYVPAAIPPVNAPITMFPWGGRTGGLSQLEGPIVPGGG